MKLESRLSSVRSFTLAQWVLQRPADLVQALAGALEELLEETDSLESNASLLLAGWQQWLQDDLREEGTVQLRVDTVLTAASVRERLVQLFQRGEDGCLDEALV